MMSYIPYTQFRKNKEGLSFSPSFVEDEVTHVEDKNRASLNKAAPIQPAISLEKRRLTGGHR